MTGDAAARARVFPDLIARRFGAFFDRHGFRVESVSPLGSFGSQTVEVASEHCRLRFSVDRRSVDLEVAAAKPGDALDGGRPAGRADEWLPVPHVVAAMAPGDPYESVRQFWFDLFAHPRMSPEEKIDAQLVSLRRRPARTWTGSSSCAAAAGSRAGTRTSGGPGSRSNGGTRGRSSRCRSTG